MRRGLATEASARVDSSFAQSPIERTLVLRRSAEPNGMQPILSVLRQRGSVMRARINLPVFERSASHGSGSAVREKQRARVIA